MRTPAGTPSWRAAAAKLTRSNSNKRTPLPPLLQYFTMVRIRRPNQGLSRNLDRQARCAGRTGARYRLYGDIQGNLPACSHALAPGWPHPSKYKTHGLAQHAAHVEDAARHPTHPGHISAQQLTSAAPWKRETPPAHTQLPEYAAPLISMPRRAPCRCLPPPSAPPQAQKQKTPCNSARPPRSSCATPARK